MQIRNSERNKQKNIFFSETPCRATFSYSRLSYSTLYMMDCKIKLRQGDYKNEIEYTLIESIRIFFVDKRRKYLFHALLVFPFHK